MEPTVVFGKTPFLQSTKGKLTILGGCLLLLLLGLLILNYFTSFIPILPHKSLEGLQPSQQILNNPLPLNPVIKVAGKAGYNIIWLHPEDLVGRTVLYSNREKADYNFQGVGIIDTQLESDPDKTIVSYIGGLLQSFEAIKDSNDEYVNLIDPLSKIPLPKIRILFTKNASGQTNFIVENLSYGPNNPYSFKEDLNENDLGILSDWKKDNLKKIIKQGDAIIVSVLSKTKEGKLINEKEQNDHFVGTLLVVRRIGGKEQIDKELKDF